MTTTELARMTAAELAAVIPCPGTGPTRRCCAAHMRHLAGIEDYLFIGGDRMSAAQAARRLGVTDRTIQRYRATLRPLTGTRLSGSNQHRRISA